MAGWSTSPVEFLNVIETDIVKRRAEIAVDALQMVISASPVDTGEFRGSHRVTVDVEDLTAHYTEDKGGGDTIAAGMKIIARAKKPLAAIIIQTNLPYSEKLENGHSGQAPGGIYGPAFASLVAKYGGNR